MCGVAFSRWNGTGSLIAIWALWSELTAVILNVETYSDIYWKHTREWIHAVIVILGTISFWIQRGIVFIYLFYLCLLNFSSDIKFLVGFVIFGVGLALNLKFCWGRWFDTVEAVETAWLSSTTQHDRYPKDIN